MGKIHAGRMYGRALAALILAAVAACAPLPSSQPGAARQGFVSSWGTALMVPNGKVAIPAD
ncbi:MAG: hypothetical protein ABIT83_08940, partial [Massilia sp.]